MEEKKNKTMGVVKEGTPEKEQQKLSYEQLEQAAGYFKGQYDKCFAQLQEAQKLIANFNDIGMLLSIIKEGHNFDSAFIERCSKKVQDVVTQMLDNADENEKETEK